VARFSDAEKFIPLSAAATAAPDTVRAVVDALALVPARLMVQGSITSEPLREILEPVPSRFGITPGHQNGFASKEIHFSATRTSALSS
jgi:hypothetical protein